jgi:hypothetical protein
MRYPDGGGLTAAGRARRESVRLQAAWLYEQDVSAVQVAHRLRVAGQLARLRAALEGGPAAWGWDQDQRWTLLHGPVI